MLFHKQRLQKPSTKKLWQMDTGFQKSVRGRKY